MAITTITSIDLASDVRNFISKVNVDYSHDSFRTKIFSTDGDSFLKVTKTIGSDTKIVNVVLIDNDYVLEAIKS
jgi:hypothetical protein